MFRKVFCLASLVLLFVGPSFAGDPVPVLCYHGFTDDSASAKGTLTETYRRFREMLQFLTQQGYVSCFPEEVQSGACASDRRVIITFDDGTKDQLRAAELLHENGFKGIFFVVPNRFSDESNRYFTSADVNLLARWGDRVAVHGFAHRPLTSSPEEIEASVGRSRDTLRRTVQPEQPLNDFAFPFGHYDNRMIDTLCKVYRFLHTVNPGYWDGRSPLIPRMLLTADESMEFYQRYLADASSFRPELVLVSDEGSVSNMVKFAENGDEQLDSLELMSVSPDVNGRLYALHPLNKFMVVDGGGVTIDLGRLMKEYYSPKRRVISYVLVRPWKDGVRYLSNGHTHWIAD